MSLQKRIGLPQTKASLQAALGANRNLQVEIVRQLQQVNQRKCHNRRAAARCIERLAHTEEEEDPARSPPSIPTPSQVAALFPNEEKKKLTYSKRKQFQYDPARRWNWEFFTDPTGSRPELNEDVKKRRKLETETFFYHTSPTWSKQQINNLKTVVKEQEQEGDLDFESVAQELQQRSSKGDKGLPVTALPRTANECRLYHQHSLSPKQPFTKEESLRILEEVQKAKDQQNLPDWQHIAASLGNNRTIWQTFSHYRQRLETLPAWTSTIEQDELLLRYLAIQGPQFVWDIKAAAHLSTRLIPTATPKQLLPRTNQTLLNPNLTTDYWKIDPERKLVLAMKVYDGSVDHSAINVASTHFPNRAAQKVSRKWERSLNPNLDTSPFTQEEDAKLVQVVRSSNAGFADIARQHFPQRIGTQIYQRWTGTATTDDIVQKYSESTILQGVKKQSLLSPDDFRLEWKKADES